MENGITIQTILTKVMTLDEFKTFHLGQQRPKVMGFVYRFGDISHINSYQGLRESLRLDYSIEDNGHKIEPFPKDGGKLVRVLFMINDQLDPNIVTPYHPKLEETSKLPIFEEPITMNGYTASENEEMIPEYFLSNPVSCQMAVYHLIEDDKVSNLASYNVVHGVNYVEGGM